MSAPLAEQIGSVELVRQVGITYRQLDYWCRQGFIPGIEACGSGYVHTFTAEQVRYVWAMARLVDIGMTPSKAAGRLAAELASTGQTSFAVGKKVLVTVQERQ